MMDILTVLLLFLLKSFVVDAGITTPPPDVRLPHSTSQDVPEMSLVVAVSGDAILVGDHPVTTVARALAGDGLLIRELEAELGRELDRMDEVARQRGSGGFDGQVTIQGDKDVEFKLLQRVMYTCNAAGADRMALAVVKES
jgi:biopolymer transport protein ExbD